MDGGNAEAAEVIAYLRAQLVAFDSWQRTLHQELVAEEDQKRALGGKFDVIGGPAALFYRRWMDARTPVVMAIIWLGKGDVTAAQAREVGSELAAKTVT